MLENLLEEAFKIKEISVIICVAEIIIYRRMNEYNSSKISFTNDSDAAYANELFEWVWPCRISLLLKELLKSKHCMKSIRIRSYSGPYFLAFRLKTDKNNSKYGHFLRSERDNNAEIAIKGQYPLCWRKTGFIEKNRKLKRRFRVSSRPKLRSAFPVTSRKLQNRRLRQS